jgi:hypothetical protein
MFHVKSNFRAGAPISQVPTSWFNKVADFLNNFVAGYGLKLKKSSKGPFVISLDPAVVPKPLTHEVGEAADKSDTSPDDYQDTEPWEWQAGGGNGLIVDAYCRIDEENDWHYLSRCRLTISKDGLITKVEGLSGQKEISG